MTKVGRPAKLVGREAEVIAAYRAGASLAELEERFNVSRSPVKRVLIAAGATRSTGRPRKLDPSHAAEVIAAYNAGESMSSIGARFNASHHPIRRMLQDHGVAIRHRQGDSR